MMTLMKPNVIVGGGLSGLLVARILLEKGLPFIGFERSSSLGGRAEWGPHRILKSQTRDYLENLVPEIHWIAQENDAKERIKGDWSPLKDGYLENEKFYFSNSFFSPQTPIAQFLNSVAAPILENFQLQKTVIRIDGTQNKLELADGTEQEFEKLFWCSDLHLLFKLWEGEPLGTPKTQKKASEKKSGFNLILDLDQRFFETEHTVVLPFRFKEWKLRAIGIQDLNDQSEKNRLHWLVFLPKEIMEDREEVAKTVRTLKRELLKEFPELSSRIQKEKIVYSPNMSAEEAARFGSLEIAPDIFCVGPQIFIEEEQSEWKNLDLVVAHTKSLRAQTFA